MELGREAALVDARVSQLLRNLNEGDSVAAWNEAVFAFRAYKRNLLKRDRPAADESFARLENILEHESEKHKAWFEVKELIALRRKLSDSQTKREERLLRFVESRKVALLFNALTSAIKLEIHDPQTVERIGKRFQEILSINEAKALTAAA
jgi:hypothetical protein